MRTLATALALCAVASAAQAQQTTCRWYGTVWSCYSTPAPQPNPALQQGEASLGAAVGEMIRERRDAAQAQQQQAAIIAQRTQLANAMNERIGASDCLGAINLALSAGQSDMAQTAANYCRDHPAPAPAADPTRTEIEHDIEAFAANPAHPYFQILKERMAELLEQGHATTLDQAYEMAIAENPALQQARR